MLEDLPLYICCEIEGMIETMSLLYTYDKDLIRTTLKTKKYQKLMLQFPEGMLGDFLQDVIAFLTTEFPNVEYVISADPSYGACDLAFHNMLRNHCDLLIHFGHNVFRPRPGEGKRNLLNYQYMGHNIEVLYVPTRANVDILPISRECFIQASTMGWQVIGIATTVQHIHQLAAAAKLGADMGFQIKIFGSGQILGCDVQAALQIKEDVDGFIVISGGQFHGKGVILGTGVETIVGDPFTNKITFYSSDVYLTHIKKRYAAITKAKEATRFGIVISTKSGQFEERMAEVAKKWLRERGKEAFIISCENFTPSVALNFPFIEVWVVTACPRIVVDDAHKFLRPLLDFNELAVVLGKRTWERHVKYSLIPWNNVRPLH